MSPRVLHWSGWTLLIGALVSIVSAFLTFAIPGPAGQSGPSSIPVSVVSLVGGILILLGLPASYMRQAKQVGRLGLIGFIALWLTALLFAIVLSIIGIVAVSSNPASAFAGPPPPFLMVFFLVGTVLEVIGGALFGIMTIRAHVFPSLIGWMLIVAVILGLVGFPLSGVISTIVGTVSSVLLFLALAWLGYALASQPTEEVVQSAGSATGASS